ncbi:Hypothetical predicted protein [Olea europaea subsp. europaea]|uniref:Uncharacterized protein n=1 Tax=Olea europaea subsp. europaea TaxID=158383 RepID=A0A8S0R9R5_OLEEU|nr:Hypothetical predicted protein [Olea europaea subsp. europaea]
MAGSMRVCKAWLQECKDPTLNSVFDPETDFDSVTELPRFWTPEFESRIDNMIVSVGDWSHGSLSEIRVRHCSDRSLSLVAQRQEYFQHNTGPLKTMFSYARKHGIQVTIADAGGAAYLLGL